MIEIKDENDDNGSRYFGEISQKLRNKVTGHTMKTPAAMYKRNVVETKIARATRIHAHKRQEIPITEIEDYFDYSFCKGNERLFNTPERWEDLESVLEENAIKISKEYNRYEGHCKIHYDLPIIGHRLYRTDVMNTKKLHLEEHWVFWNGKYYDPDYIYQYVPYYQPPIRSNDSDRTKDSDDDCYEESYQIGYLKKLCPSMKFGKDPLTILGKIDDKHNRILTKCLTKRNNDLIQIDLGRICEITHIGTLGGYPTRLDSFPYNLDENYWHSRIPKENRRLNRKKYRFLSVIKDEGELSWVVRYKLEYRDLQTVKWIQYESSFVGNNDIGTENIHKISLLARYLRITALDYHNQKRMRVNIYGDGLKKELKDGELEIETVRYTVSPPSLGKVLDGYGNGSAHCFRYAPPPSKKIAKYKMLQEAVSSYYDER